MRADEEKLSKATDVEILAEINLINMEIEDECHPCSAYRCLMLLEYKKRLKKELRRRGYIENGILL